MNATDTMIQLAMPSRKAHAVFQPRYSMPEQNHQTVNQAHCASALVMGYEVTPQESDSDRDIVSLKWICQLNCGRQVYAHLSTELTVDVFEAMHYIGRTVQLSFRGFTHIGLPLAPVISQLK